MKKKQLLALIGMLLLSALLSFAGALFKLQHYDHGSALVIAGLVCWVVSIGLIIFTSIKNEKQDEQV